jgi:uncharacterized protein (TIGR02271 family)
METTERPLIVGVFRDHTLAERAIDELQHAGLRSDEIWSAGQGGGLLSFLKSRTAGGEDGTLHDRLIAEGLPEEDAQYYQNELDAGRSLVVVQSYGHQQEARTILDRFGAYNARSNPSRLKDVHTIHLRAEELQAHKEPVEVGEVLIRKVVVTEEKTITVPIKREEIVIERRSVPASPDDGTAHLPEQPREGRVIEVAENETIRIPLYTEQVSVEKHPVMAEEVLVSKRGIQETRRFTDTVQREEVRMERQGNVIVHGDAVEEVVPREEQKMDQT